MWGVVLARGPDSVAFRWVKGHTTQSDIESGMGEGEIPKENEGQRQLGLIQRGAETEAAPVSDQAASKEEEAVERRHASRKAQPGGKWKMSAGQTKSGTEQRLPGLLPGMSRTAPMGQGVMKESVKMKAKVKIRIKEAKDQGIEKERLVYAAEENQ